jgi:hypothetical protein
VVGAGIGHELVIYSWQLGSHASIFALLALLCNSGGGCDDQVIPSVPTQLPCLWPRWRLLVPRPVHDTKSAADENAANGRTCPFSQNRSPESKCEWANERGSAGCMNQSAAASWAKRTPLWESAATPNGNSSTWSIMTVHDASYMTIRNNIGAKGTSHGLRRLA